MVRVRTEKLSTKKVGFGIFKRAKWCNVEIIKDYTMNVNDLQEAILQCCTQAATKPVVTYIREDGEQEVWSLWRLIIEHNRVSVAIKEAEIKNSLEYKQTAEGIQKEAEKLAKVMNAEFKTNFLSAVKAGLKDYDTSGIAVIV